MIGAGQLARTTHQAAVDLDSDLVVLAESVPARIAVAPCDIRAVAAGADVVTFDHELLPARAQRAAHGTGAVRMCKQCGR